MSYTPQQQAAIEARGKIIVSASAGSGKTFVMIERLVGLILGGVDVREILALTFTNKAASEMRERLRDALIKKLGAAAGEERARLKAQLTCLPLAEIGTIHAFCGRLARTYFYLLGEGEEGISPSFRIISPDDAEGKTLSARAIAEVFEEKYEEGSEAFSELLAVYFRKKKDRKLRDTVLALHRAVRGSIDPAALFAAIGQDRFLRAKEILFEDYKKTASVLLRKAGELKEKLSEIKQAQKICDEIIDVSQKISSENDLFRLSLLAKSGISFSRMPGGKKVDETEREELETLGECLKKLKGLLDELKGLGTEEEEHARGLEAGRRAAALAALAADYDRVYARLKREGNLVDYDDLEHFALKILGNAEARREIREKFPYVFVDEYQDVNPVQEEILSRIADKELFLVGDSKQAIYGFRGSNSEYFDAKGRELETSLLLTANFRSVQKVLDATNLVMRPLFADYPDMVGGSLFQEGEGTVSFHHVEEPAKEETERGIYSVLTGTGKEETDALAQTVCRLVEEEHAGAQWFNTKADGGKGALQPVTYGDIAVLVRKKSGDAERIVRALSSRGIPVTTSSKVNVCDYFEARLLIDWLSFFDNAEQDIPYVTALLSAIGGFTDSELARIRLRFSSAYTFRGACREYMEKMADPLSQKLRAFEGRAGELRAYSRIATAEELLMRLLSEGLEAQIAAKEDGRVRLARVNRLIAEAEGCKNVHEFLARLKASDYKVEYSESGGEGAVSILTMHASKGLEYPVVILASLDTEFHGADHDELMWTDELLLSPRSYDVENKTVYETVERRAAAVLQRREELKGERNLLYVGMTRARCRLHLLFKDVKRAVCPDFARRLSDLIDIRSYPGFFAKETGEEKTPIPRKALAFSPSGKDYLSMLNVLYGREYAHEESVLLPVKSSATALLKDLPAPAIADGHGESFDVETGLAYHAFLQHVVFGAPVREELARMRKQGLLSEEACSLLSEEKLEEIARLPAIRELKGKRVWREQTFLVRLKANEMLETPAEDDILFQGAIDLLAETEEGYLILDYKFSGHDAAYLKARYGKQISLYRKAVSRILRVDEGKIRARIVNLALGFEVEL